MQAIFIFTHLIMIGAVSTISYMVFEIEPKETGIYAVPQLREHYLTRKYKVFACGVKTIIAGLKCQLSRLKIANILTRRSGEII
nr:hypothetical protein [Mucilaginibacter sp. X4EP1]